MATLLEKLQQNLSPANATIEPGDETTQVRQLMAAKKGIVGPTSALGPRGLETAEIAARQPAQQKLSEIAQGAQLQGVALSQAVRGQEMEQAQREEAISAQRREGALQEKIQTENILRNLEQGKASMSEQQRQLGMEAAASNLRLQDAKYVDDLVREGQKARLQQDIDFGEQLAKATLDNNIALQKLKYKNQSLLNADDRTFKRALADLDINAVMQMAKENATADIQAGTIGGLASAAQVGAQAYGSYKSGSLSQDYKSYAEKERVAGRVPMSYTAWDAQTQRRTEDSDTFVGPSKTQAGTAVGPSRWTRR